MRIIKNIGLMPTDDGDKPTADVIIRNAFPVDHQGQRITHW